MCKIIIIISYNLACRKTRSIVHKIYKMSVLRTVITFSTKNHEVKWNYVNYCSIHIPTFHIFNQVISISPCASLNSSQYSNRLNESFFHCKCRHYYVPKGVSTSVRAMQARQFHKSYSEFKYGNHHKSLFHAADLLGNVDNPEVVDELFKGLVEQNRASLARSITLVESRHPGKYKQAQLLLAKVLEYMVQHDQHLLKGPRSFRVGMLSMQYVFFASFYLRLVSCQTCSF